MTDVTTFVASMPAEYRSSFGDRAAEAHAAIAAARGRRAAHVARWDGDRDDSVAICVVADDAPGLLSRISEALVAHEIDVVVAEAYCRQRDDGKVEAVDLLWIHRASAPLVARDIDAIGEMLDALVRGDARFDAVPAHTPRAPRGGARIRFDRDPDTGAIVLTVEAADRPGLLLAITKTIFLARLQIVALHARSERKRAVDRFHLAELDGGSLDLERLLELQSAILAAIDDASAA